MGYEVTSKYLSVFIFYLSINKVFQKSINQYYELYID